MHHVLFYSKFLSRKSLPILPHSYTVVHLGKIPMLRLDFPRFMLLATPSFATLERIFSILGRFTYTLLYKN